MADFVVSLNCLTKLTQVGWIEVKAVCGKKSLLAMPDAPLRGLSFRHAFMNTMRLESGDLQKIISGETLTTSRHSVRLRKP